MIGFNPQTRLSWFGRHSLQYVITLTYMCVHMQYCFLTMTNTTQWKHLGIGQSILISGHPNKSHIKLYHRPNTFHFQLFYILLVYVNTDHDEDFGPPLNCRSTYRIDRDLLVESIWSFNHVKWWRMMLLSGKLINGRNVGGRRCGLVEVSVTPK